MQKQEDQRDVQNLEGQVLTQPWGYARTLFFQRADEFPWESTLLEKGNDIFLIMHIQGIVWACFFFFLFGGVT